MIKTRSFLVMLAMAFALVLGMASLAFADEAATHTASSDAAIKTAQDEQISIQASSLTVVDFNGHDPRNVSILIGERLNVRVQGNSSTNVTWTSSDPSVIQVQPGTVAGLKNDSECTLLSVGAGMSNITATCNGETYTFRVLTRQINITSDAYYWTAPATCTYSGSALKPLVGIAGTTYTLSNGKVLQGNGQLKQGVDYKITYSNNTNVGTATAVVEGIGLYTGKRTFTFKIEPVPTKPSDSSGSSGSSGPSGSPDSSVASNTPSQAGIAGPSGATVVVPQAPPASKAVSGTWKKTKGLWWFKYDAATAKLQGKPWPRSEWVTIGGKRYHFGSNGYMHSGWFNSGTAWYWLGADGAMKTGWAKTGGKWYYMASDGVMQTGKKLIGTLIYFLKSSGAMVTGWNKESKGWFYYKNSGVMATGWQKVSGKWYYLMPSSGVMKTGWLDLGTIRYYLNRSGTMLTGWQKISSKWYYFAESGAMTKDKWVGNYYLGSDGVMATNTWITTKGVAYYVDGSGKWVKGKKR